MCDMADDHIVIFEFTVFPLVATGHGPPRQKKSQKNPKCYGINYVITFVTLPAASSSAALNHIWETSSFRLF